jgi:hypothetical protein
MTGRRSKEVQNSFFWQDRKLKLPQETVAVFSDYVKQYGITDILWKIDIWFKMSKVSKSETLASPKKGTLTHKNNLPRPPWRRSRDGRGNN